MRSKKYGLEIYGQPNRNAWVSRDASGGNDGAHVTGAEIENGNRLKLTLSDGQLIVASGTISTGHFSDSTSQVGSIFFDNGSVGLGPDADFAAKLHISGRVLSTGSANFGGTNFTDGVIIDSESIKIIPRSTVTHSSSNNQATASNVGPVYGYAWVFNNNDLATGYITLSHYNAVVENTTIITDGGGVEWLVKYKYTYIDGATTYYVFFSENVNAPNIQISYQNVTWPGGPALVTADTYEDIGYYDFAKGTGMTQELFDDAAIQDSPGAQIGELLDAGEYGEHRLLRKQEFEQTFRFWYKVNTGSYPQDLPVNIGWGGATSGVATNPAKIELYCESSGSHKVTLQAPSHANFSGDVVFTLPNSTGSANQVLVTDGSGATSWVDGSTITGTSQSSESSNDPTFLIDFSFDVRPETGGDTSSLTLYDFVNDSAFYYGTSINIAGLENNAGFDRTTSTSFETSPSDAQNHFISGFIPCDSTVTKVQMSFATPSNAWGWPSGITMLIFKGSYVNGADSNIQWNLISRLSTGPIQGGSIAFFEESLSSSNTFSKGDLWCAAFYSDDNPNDIGSGPINPINFRGNLYFSDSSYDGGTSQGGGQSGGPGDRGQSTDDPEIVYNSALFEITEVTVNELSRIEGEETKIKFLVKGMNESNHDSFIDFSNPRVTIPSQTGWFANPEEITTNFDFLPNDYTLITHSWTTGAGVHTGTQLKLTIRYSDTGDIHLAPLSIFTLVSSIAEEDPFTIAANDQPGLGYIDLLPAVESGDRTGVVISPPYLNTEDGIMSFSDNHTWGPDISRNDIEVDNNGLRWEIKAYEAVSLSDRTNGAPINYMPRSIAGGGQQGFGAFVARWTQNGQGYYSVDSGDPSNDPKFFTRMNFDPQVQGQRIQGDHNSWTSPVSGAPQINAEITSTDDGYGIFAFGLWEHTYNHDTSVPFPDENTTFDLYMSKKSTGLLGISGEGSDIKIQIDIGDYISGKPAAENMTVKYFRNHNTSDTEAPVWTQYDKLYLCGKQPGEVSSGNNSDDSSDDGIDPIGVTYSKIRIVSVSQNLSMVQGETSSFTLGLTGVDASNYNKFFDFESPMKLTTSFGRSYSSNEISAQFSSDYSLLTVSWTNLDRPPVANANSYIVLLYGHTTQKNLANAFVSIYFNTLVDPIEIGAVNGMGRHLEDINNGNRPGLLLSPPYVSNSELLVGYDNLIQHQSHKPSRSWYYHNGPAWHLKLFDVRPNLELNDYANNRYSEEYGIGSMAARFTREGILYEIEMTDRLQWDLSGGNYNNPDANTLFGSISAEDDSDIGILSLKMWYFKNSGTPRTTNVIRPDENTDIFFYIKRESALFNSTPEELSTDIKIKINMGPFVNGTPVAENMTINFYRNHNTSNTGIPYWVEYNEIYLAGQPLRSVAAGAPTILDVNGFGQDGKIQVMFEDVASNNSTSIEYTTDGQNWTAFESTVSPQTISGLQNGTSYTIKLRSKNALGTLGESNSLSATPTPTMLSAPDFTLTPLIDGFRIDPFSRPEHSSSRPISGYIVEITGVDGLHMYTEGTGLESGRDFTTSSDVWPEIGETYSVRIKSIHEISGDESMYSSSASVAMGIPPAMAPTITSLEYNSLKELIISHNTNDVVSGGTKIYEYSLNGGAWTTYYHTIDGVSQLQSAPIISVDTAIKNSVSMRIRNIIGTGPESSPAFLPIDILPTASEIGPDSIKWSFTPLGAEYGITKYYISTKWSGAAWQSATWEELPADTYEYLQTGLGERLQYHARIKSENAYGESHISGSSYGSAFTGVSPSRLSAGSTGITPHESGLLLGATALNRDAWDASGGDVEFIIEFTNVDTEAINEVVIVPFDNQMSQITIPSDSKIISTNSYFFVQLGSRYKIRGKQRASFDGGATTHESAYSNFSSEAVAGISPSFDFPYTELAFRGTFQEFGVTSPDDGFSFNFGINGGSVDTSTSNFETTITSELGLRYSVDGDGIKRVFGQVSHIDDHKFHGTIYGDPTVPHSDEIDYQSGVDYNIQLHFDTGAFSGDSDILTHRHSLLPPKPSVALHHAQGTTAPWPRIKVFYNSQDHKDFADLIPFINSRFDGEDISNVRNLIVFQYETNLSGVWRDFAGADHTAASGGDFGDIAITTNEYITKLAQDLDTYLHIQTVWDSSSQQWLDLRDSGYPEGQTFNIRIRTAGVKVAGVSGFKDRFGEPSDPFQVTVGPQ